MVDVKCRTSYNIDRNAHLDKTSCFLNFFDQISKFLILCFKNELIGMAFKSTEKQARKGFRTISAS